MNGNSQLQIDAIKKVERARESPRGEANMQKTEITLLSLSEVVKGAKGKVVREREEIESETVHPLNRADSPEDYC
jgi:hypothetical protein